MKYQALKQLKTKNKLIKLCDTFQEAENIIKATGAQFHSKSYIGDFPIYTKENQTYSIQGAVNVNGQLIVCSLPEQIKK